jgi:hypothetical protein
LVLVEEFSFSVLDFALTAPESCMHYWNWAYLGFSSCRSYLVMPTALGNYPTHNEQGFDHSIEHYCLTAT